MDPRDTRFGLLAAGSATIVVGTSFAASSALTEFPFALGQAARYGLAAVILLALCRGRLVRPTRGELLRLAGVALFGLLLFNVLVIAAVDAAAPSSVGVIVGCSPVVLAIAAPLLQGRRPQRGLLGAAVLVALGAGVTEGLGAVSPTGVGLALGALVCESLFSLLAAPLLARLGPLQVSVWACALGTAMCAALALAGPAPRSPEPGEALALAYLALPVTVGAFVGWYAGVARLGVERAGLLIGLMPLTAWLGGLALGADALAVAPVAGSALVGLGVIAGLRPARSRTAGAVACGPSAPRAGVPLAGAGRVSVVGAGVSASASS